MICIKAEIPQCICEVDDELAIYHSMRHGLYLDIRNEEDRNKFMVEDGAC